MKTEEPNAIKEEVVTVSKKPAELTGDELEQVSGGNSLGIDNNDGISCDAGSDKSKIVIPEGKSLVVKNPEKTDTGTTGGGADIFVPESSSLIIVGKGELDC